MAAAGRALIQMEKELVLALLFQAAGPIAAEILRRDDTLDPQTEGDVQAAVERAMEGVLNPFAERNRTWSRDSTEPEVAELLDQLLWARVRE